MEATLDRHRPAGTTLFYAHTDKTDPTLTAHSVHVSTATEWPHAVFVAWLDNLKESLAIKSDNQLAERAGVSSASVISNWRQGKTQPDTANLRKLANAGGVLPARVFVLAGRLEEQDIEGPSGEVDPLPRQIQELIDLWRAADEDTAAVLLGQVEFIVRAIGRMGR